MYVGEATVDQENFESFLSLAQEVELTGLTIAAEKLKLQSSGSAEYYSQNMNALESKAPLLASNCSRATPARPHSFNDNKDVTAKACVIEGEEGLRVITAQVIYEGGERRC